jgi:hypothetical protein
LKSVFTFATSSADGQRAKKLSIVSVSDAGAFISVERAGETVGFPTGIEGMFCPCMQADMVVIKMRANRVIRNPEFKLMILW